MENPQLQADLNNDLAKSKEIVAAVQNLQRLQEDTDRKRKDELRAHEDDKQRIKLLELEHVQTKQAAENEAKLHIDLKEMILKEETYHQRTKETDRAAREDVASMRLQMDAMKVEMEAQKKAFVINVNWAARCTELKAKYDQSCNEYDDLLDEHVKTKSAMDAALRSQEEFRMKFQAAIDQHTLAQEEMARQQAEYAARTANVSDEVQAKLNELEVFRDMAAEAATKAKLGNQQALAVLQRSMAQGEEGLKVSAFQGWASLTKTEKDKKMQKDRAMKAAAKNIAGEGTALCCNVFKEWRADVEKDKRAALKAATARLQEASGNAGAGSMAGRQNAIKQLEKQFQGEDYSLKKTCFQGWALGQVARKKKEQNHKKATRMMGNSSKALMAEIFGLWNDLTEKRRKTNREKAANMQKAGRFIANSTKAVVASIFTNWWGMIEDIRRERKGKEAGTAKAMRMMANSGAALMNLCFDSWAKHFKESKKKDAGNKKALRMMADSAQGLIIAVWEGWSTSSKTCKAKEANTAKAVRMINSSSEALTAAVFQSWAGDCRKNKDKNKKIRVLEKSFGAQDTGLKVVVVTAWQGYAKVEGRRKRAKELSMKTAVKSITGNTDLLLCHLSLAWARYASFSRIEKLNEATQDCEFKLKDAVEKARVAIEQDLAKAKAEVESITTELEGLRSERDTAQARAKEMTERLEEGSGAVSNYDRQISSITSELQQSRRKAKDIGDELARVGIFIGAHATVPRKNSRTGSAGQSRPLSGAKTSDERLPALPKISGTNSRPRSGATPDENGSNSRPRSGKTEGSKSARGDRPEPDENGSSSRPRSGAKSDGSKSARGVTGERGGSGRREGRPPTNPSADSERRYMMDGSGPYTYNEQLDMSAEKGRQNAIAEWSSCMPERQDPNNYGDYGVAP